MRKSVKTKVNTLRTMVGLTAAAKRRKLRPFEVTRLKSLKVAKRVRENSAYERTVKYALGRGKRLPDPANKTQAKLAERLTIERGLNPPKKRARSDTEKLRRKFRPETSKYGLNGVNYFVPFKRGYESGDNDNRRLIIRIDVEKIRHAFLIERTKDTKDRSRIMRGYISVMFRGDKKTTVIATKQPLLAADDAWERMAAMTEELIVRYAVKSVRWVKVYGTF